MPIVNLAFYTVGDTRSPNAQALAAERRRRRTEAQRRPIPQATVSDVYRDYARRIVRNQDRVFGVASTGEARRSVEAWALANQQDSIGNAYFIGHGNQFFPWSVTVGAADDGQ